MKILKGKYIVTMAAALLITASSANALGVFYYDSANHKFVIDDDVEILNTKTLKLDLSELNQSNDAALFINGNTDVQIRIDADDEDADNNSFKINNGDNNTVFIIEESGNVGIGTSAAPVASLEIHNNNESGYLATLSDVATKSALKISPHATNTTSFYFGQGDNGNAQIVQAANFNGSTAYNLSLNPFGGSVAIGRLVPSHKLDINGDLRIRTGWRGLRIDGSNNNPHNYDFIVGCIGGGTCPASREGGFALYDDTAAQYRFVIDKDGNFGINTIDPSYALHVAGDSFFDDHLEICNNCRFVIGSGNSDPLFINRHVVSNDQTHLRINLGDDGLAGDRLSIGYDDWQIAGADWQEVFAFVMNGTTAGISDIRNKKDIGELAYGLNEVTLLEPISYRMKQESENASKTIGLSAQAVEKIIPELVSTSDTGTKMMDYSRVSIVLINAIKELKAENDDLRARVENLESKLK